MEKIIETLKQANTESTAAPYWLILDPMPDILCNVYDLANRITGIFFCREDAEEYLRNNSYDFSDKAIIYCKSGYPSEKYSEFYSEIN